MSDDKNPVTLAAMSAPERAFVEWLIDEGIDPAELDIDRNGTAGEISFEEAAAYALASGGWEKYLPELEKVDKKFKHPLDTRNYPPEIRKRIEELGQRAKDAVTLPPDAPGYCDALLDEFFWQAAPSFENGGICLGISGSKGPSIEITSEDFFGRCRVDNHDIGECTEHTYAQMTSVQLAGIPCELTLMNTENHVFPAHDGAPYDISKIGRIGWERSGKAVATYYYNKSIKTGDETMSRIASIIDPQINLDLATFDKLIMDKKYDDALALADPVMAVNGKRAYFANAVLPYTLKLPFDAALDLSTSIMKKWPDYPYASLPILFLFSNASAEGKKKIIETLSKEFPKSGWAETFALNINVDSSSYEAHVEALNKIIEANPNNTLARMILALKHNKLGQFDLARDALKKAISIAPNYPGIHGQLASVYENQGKYGGALDELSREQFNKVTKAQAILQAANVYLRMGEPMDALAKYEYLLKSMPDEASWHYPTIYSSMSYAYLRTGEPIMAALALNELKKVVTDEDTFAEASFSFDIYNGDYSNYEKYIAAHPEKWKTSRRFAVFEIMHRMHENRISEAEGFLNESGGILSEEDKKYFKGEIELQKGNIDAATAIFSEMLSKDPYDSGAKYELIKCLLSAGKMTAASNEQAAASTWHPGLFSIRSLHPLVLLGRGRAEDSLSEADDLLRTYPTNEDLLVASTKALIVLHREEEAVIRAEEMLAMHPESLEARALLAEAYLKKGDYKHARQHATELQQLKKDAAILWPLVNPDTILASCVAEN